ncbi:MAG: hypothetical protein LUC50_06845 [Ruminococcus sp.]|nr:hypothetical protein [Ruminococcus sp.]
MQYCTKCGKPTDNANKICDACDQEEFHEIVQEMEVMYEEHNRSYGKEEIEKPEKPAKKALILVSFLIPIAGILIGIIALSNHHHRSGKAYLLTAFLSMICSGLLKFFLSILTQ